MPEDSVSLLDIYEAGQQILSYGEGLSPLELQADRMRTSAILYQILIIGEATKRLSLDFRRQHPDIPWDSMAGMRDIIAHQYDQIDLRTLWVVVQQSVPELLVKLEPLLPQRPSTGQEL